MIEPGLDTSVISKSETVGSLARTSSILGTGRRIARLPQLNLDFNKDQIF
jgi:hypothetical protein